MIVPKIAIIGSFIFSVFVAVRVKFYIYDVIPIFYLVILNYRTILKVLKRLIKLNGFVFFVCAGIYFFHKDLKTAETIFIRSNLIIFFNLLVFNNYIPFDVYRGIIKLPIPKKLKILFLFFIKFIEIFQREYSKLLDALKIRGFKPKTNIFTYKSYAYILAILFAKTLKKAKNLYNAIELRGFKGTIYSFYNDSIKLNDIFLIIAIFIQILIFTFLRIF